MPEFTPFPKIPRLTGGMVITEKIDGTNAAIVVTEDYGVFAQSRTRILSTDQDNYGFHAWLFETPERVGNIAEALGPGVHFGEWWGQGIQRGYGLTEKRFSLFNSGRWNPVEYEAGYRCAECPELFVVPILFQGAFSTEVAKNVEEELRFRGSQAAAGFMNPEGIVIFDTAGRNMYKLNDAKQGAKHEGSQG
jgi:hypothetical protein